MPEGSECPRSRTSVNPQVDTLTWGEGLPPFITCNGCNQLVGIAMISNVYVVGSHRSPG